MAAGPSIYQGEDKTIIVKTNVSLVAATEIEFIIDTDTQIKKTLTGEEARLASVHLVRPCRHQAGVAGCYAEAT